MNQATTTDITEAKGSGRRSSGRRRRVLATLAGALALTTMAGLSPAGAHTHTASSTTVNQSYEVYQGPVYQVKAVRFKAIDESGWDGSWYAPVSDEPYWIFSSVGVDGSQRTNRSVEFSDVDSGETRTFPSSTPSLFYGQAPHGIGFSIQLWEADGPDWLDEDEIEKAREYSRTGFKAAGGIAAAGGASAWVTAAIPVMAGVCDSIMESLEDDLLGSRTYAYSASSLSTRLPSVGSSFTETRVYNGAETSGGADYSLTVRVSRVG